MNKKKNFIKENIKKEDLSPEQQRLLDFLGIEKYLEMSERIGGSSFCVAKLDTLYCLCAKRKILENRDVYKNMFNQNQLASMYGISKSTIYNILKEADK